MSLSPLVTSPENFFKRYYLKLCAPLRLLTLLYFFFHSPSLTLLFLYFFGLSLSPLLEAKLLEGRVENRAFLIKLSSSINRSKRGGTEGSKVGVSISSSFLLGWSESQRDPPVPCLWVRPESRWPESHEWEGGWKSCCLGCSLVCVPCAQPLKGPPSAVPGVPESRPALVKDSRVKSLSLAEVEKGSSPLCRKKKRGVGEPTSSFHLFSASPLPAPIFSSG